MIDHIFQSSEPAESFHDSESSIIELIIDIIIIAMTEQETQRETKTLLQNDQVIHRREHLPMNLAYHVARIRSRFGLQSRDRFHIFRTRPPLSHDAHYQHRKR